MEPFHLTEDEKPRIRRNARKWRVPFTPALTIFVRHSADCKYARDEFCKRCDGPKHLRSTQDRKQVRISARTRSWIEAERKKQALEDHLAGRVPESRPKMGQRGIRQTVETFITAKRSENLSNSTLRKLRYHEIKRATREAAHILILLCNLTHSSEQFGNADAAMRDGINLGLHGS